RDSTGLSPGRFLSALRLQAAKQLLVSTSLSIADISNQVGYSSVGTFSSRFKSTVGVAPSVYRAGGGVRARVPDARRKTTGHSHTLIQGEITLPDTDTSTDTPVFVGLFPDVIPQGSPVRCAVLPGPGIYLLEDVPPGAWHVLVYSLPAERENKN